jgi:PKD repeat protein
VNLGQNAAFTDTSGYEPTSWSWDLGDGAGRSDQPNPIYNYSNLGIYDVTLTVSNRCGTDVVTRPFNVGLPTYLPLVLSNN